jgi:hypothetical protein
VTAMRKRIVIKIFPPDGKARETVFVAPPGKVYTDASLDEAVDRAVEYLDKTFPKWNFRMAKVGSMAVNFVYHGLRSEEECLTSKQILTKT